MSMQTKMVKAPHRVKNSYYEINQETMWVSTKSIRKVPDNEEVTSTHKDEQFSLKNRKIKQ